MKRLLAFLITLTLICTIAAPISALADGEASGEYTEQTETYYEQVEYTPEEQPEEPAPQEQPDEPTEPQEEPVNPDPGPETPSDPEPTEAPQEGEGGGEVPDQEPTETEVPEATPAQTEEPEATETPAPTDAPEEPQETETPDPTAEPTETPSPTDTPSPTSTPGKPGEDEEKDKAEEKSEAEDPKASEETKPEQQEEEKPQEGVDPSNLDLTYSVSHLEYGTPVVSDADVSYSYDESENMEIIFCFLTTEMDLNTAAACGIMANIKYESGFNPGVAGDAMTSFGICQWHAGRFTAMKSYCDQIGYDFHSLMGQLHYLKYELENIHTSILEYMRSVPDTEEGAYDAAYYWCYYYEVPQSRVSQGQSRGYEAMGMFPEWAEDDAEYVDLDLNGGTAAYTRKKVEHFKQYGEFPEVEKYGYTFVGWCTNPDPQKGHYVTETSIATKSHPDTLYAIWERDEDIQITEEEELKEDPEVTVDESVGTGTWIDPVAYQYIASDYGWRLHPIYNTYLFHAGTDLSAYYGQEIYAADNGRVIIAGCDPYGYGNYVVIDHNNGYQTLYAHQSELAVSLGDVVTQGQVIGYVGSTGLSTGPHLHYEVWVNYTTVEPTEYLAD